MAMSCALYYLGPPNCIKPFGFSGCRCQDQNLSAGCAHSLLSNYYFVYDFMRYQWLRGLA